MGMNYNFKDLSGQKFGKLTALERAPDHVQPNGAKRVMWKCRCDCGRITFVDAHNLRSGNSKTCGQCKYENRYEFKDDYVIGYTNTGAQFYFDKEDFDKVSQYYWRQEEYNGYIETFVKHKRLPLHRLIMDAGENDVVDHINHQVNDARKVNLRKVSHVQNAVNRKRRSDNRSGCTGVGWHKGRGQKHWKARITVNKKLIFLGCFLTYEEAVAARKEAEERYFKSYSYENSLAAVPNVDAKSKAHDAA